MREFLARLLHRGRRRRAWDAEIQQEIAAHLELEAEELRATGLEAEEARRAALRKFGNVTLVQESAREAWTVLGWIEATIADLRYAARTLLGSPGFAAAAILSLALGIGANTAVFLVVDALWWRMLPVPDPERLVRIVNPNLPDFGFPHEQYLRFRELRTRYFAGLAAVYPTDRANIRVGGPDGGVVEPAPLHVALVSGDYFSTLGVAAVRGRGIGGGGDDDYGEGGSSPVATISYALWERRFASSADILGCKLTLNETTFEIVGVMPRGFSGDSVGAPTDIWIPLSQAGHVVLEREDGEAPWVRVYARLRPGIEARAAEAAAQTVYLRSIADLSDGVPPGVRREMEHRRVVLEPAAQGFSRHRGTLARPVAILGAVVAFVLVIACANVAGLFLARFAARQREVATRLVLGAGRVRLVRQLMAESLLVAAPAGAAALPAALWAARTLVRFAGSGLSPLWLDMHPTVRVLAFTATLCFAAGVALGLAPVSGLSRFAGSRALAGLASGGGGGAGSASRGRFRMGQALAAAQVALSLALLTGAGLLVKTLRNLTEQELGVDRGGALLQVWTAPEQGGLGPGEVAPLFVSIPERVRRVPGVISASAAVVGLLEGEYAPDPGMPTPNIVAPGYFETTGMRLLAGRDFASADGPGATPVAVVNEAMARSLFGEEQPAVGRAFRFRKRAVQIVGVVRNSKYNTMRDRTGWQMFYLPYGQNAAYLFGMCVAVRTAGGGGGATAAALRARIREEMASVDARLPVLKINSMEEQIGQSLVQERLMAGVSAAFGGLAALLTCLGIYGLVSYTTALRTSEMGIRMALGATRGRIIGAVLRENLALAGAGIGVGVPAALALGRLISTRLFGVAAGDAATLIEAAALMLAVVAVACLAPAVRAARADPAVALHQ